MSGRGKASELTPPERRLIAEKIKEGWSTRDIELLTGRSPATISKVKRDLGLNKKSLFCTNPSNELKSWFAHHGNWDWKDPREKKDDLHKKRDFWTRETGSQFRTPYHFPGRISH